MKKKLKEVVDNYVSLTEKDSYNSEEIKEKIFQICGGHYTKKYIHLFLRKCIVNNPERVRLGHRLDLFYLKEPHKKLYRYTGTEKIKKYYPDIEKIKETKERNRKKNNILIQNYLSKINKTYNQFPLKKSSNKYLIIASCGKNKRKSQTLLKAKELYNNRLNNYVCQILDKKNSDYYILSSQYGLVESDSIIDNYDMSFKELDKYSIRKILNTISIRDRFDSLIRLNKYSKVFVLLGDIYLETLNLKKPFNSSSLIYIFQSKKYKDYKIKSNGDVINIYLSKQFCNVFKECNLYVKGKILLDYFNLQDKEMEFTEFINKRMKGECR